MIVCDLYTLVFCSLLFVLFFFFKQKTAYEMRISDWSSDVCSSDLDDAQRDAPPRCSLWARDDVHRRRAGARGDLRALIAERRRLRRPQCPPPLCFRPPVLAPREGSVAARQHSWAAWRRGRAARCDAANAALREVDRKSTRLNSSH